MHKRHQKYPGKTLFNQGKNPAIKRRSTIPPPNVAHKRGAVILIISDLNF
jgi:hypothetical protein